MTFRWDPSMSTGVESVDNQHKQLIAHLNDLSAAIGRGQEIGQLNATLDFLAEYALSHFGHEEMCMARYQCPAAAANRQAHQEFVRLFTAFRERLNQEGATPALAFDVEQQLMTWLMAHICGVDVKLRPCVAQSPRA